MLGSLLNRCLIMFLGYAYPAFECYKIVEKNRVEIEELRFWCQYWIIVAMLTVLERIGDVFVSWLPMYGEAKVALFIYLWYPKTRGTGFVYQTLLRPYVAKHETDIDRKLLELRARAWDLAVFYWQNCAQMGHSAFFQVLQYLASQSSKFTKTTAEERTIDDDQQNPPPPSNAPLRKPSGKNKWPPPSSPPGTPNGTTTTANGTITTVNRFMSETPRSPKVQVRVKHQTEGGQVDELSEKLRLRRSKPTQ
ncbi:hypothetical protein CerSpe_247900 [Prunus speciosa]